MKQKVILIIEDNEMNMDIAARLLEKNQFEVLRAEDGQTGIHLAITLKPDLILMDMHLPDTDGFTICQLLKANPVTATIKIIGFTAMIMEEDKKKALACGCVDVIGKPIDVTTFAKTVASYL